MLTLFNFTMDFDAYSAFNLIRFNLTRKCVKEQFMLHRIFLNIIST